MISKSINQAMEKSSWIRKMFETGNELKKIYGEENVFDLSIGNPIIEPPDSFFQEMEKLSKNRNSGKHRYMANAGFPDVRENVAKHLSRKSILETDTNHVVMSCGAGGGINVVLKTILDKDDEVIILAPYFAEYTFYIQNHGGKVVIAQTDENFNISIKNIQEKMSEKTKAIIINTPHNPTGVVYSKQDLLEFTDFLKAQQKKYNKQIYLISDEPYREIVYNNIEVPSVVSMYENSFMVYSWSKSLAVPGDRIGFIAVNPEMEHAAKVVSGLFFCTRILGFVNAPAIMQLLVKHLLDTTVDISYYEKKKNYIYEKLTSAGYEIVEPQGTFYIFPKTPDKDDLTFVDRAKDKQVLIVPGMGFGREGYFRLSYCTDDRIIEKACERLAQLI